MKKLISHSAEETKQFGRRLGRLLKKGDTVLLLANLGAGKTTFVQGVLEGRGEKSLAMSPTFIVAQSFGKKVPVHHLDFYRLTPKEILDIGVQDYLHGGGEIKPGIALVEWADRCRAIWPPERLEIRMKVKARGRDRLISLHPKGKRFLQLARLWQADT